VEKKKSGWRGLGKRGKHVTTEHTEDCSVFSTDSIDKTILEDVENAKTK
jgi:hypothetical protein